MLVSLKGIDMTTTAPPSAHPTIRSVLLGLLGIPPSVAVDSSAVSPDAVAQPDTADVYEFTSVDYPGAAQSLVFDSDGNTALGAFVFDPASASSPITAFTVAGAVYQILTVPNSTASIATGINTSGLIVGVYADVAGSAHGFATSDRSTFNDVDFPGATDTQAIDVNDAGVIVATILTLPTSSMGSSAAAARSRPSISREPQALRSPESTPTATPSEYMGTQRETTASCFRAVYSPLSTSRSPATRPPSASTTTGTSPATTPTPLAHRTVSSTPTTTSAPWTSQAPAPPN
jgi:hypothetical protein